MPLKKNRIAAKENKAVKGQLLQNLECLIRYSDFLSRAMTRLSAKVSVQISVTDKQTEF